MTKICAPANPKASRKVHLTMPTNRFSITREIGIDAAHRVPLHGSKCKGLHGHRYTIQAVCTGRLFVGGEQDGMVLDFGFLKDEMMQVIDGPCDHGTILQEGDPLVDVLVKAPVPTKLYLLREAPTAENLARHWYGLLAPRVTLRSDGLAGLARVIVWETPNCQAEYPVNN